VVYLAGFALWNSEPPTQKDSSEKDKGWKVTITNRMIWWGQLSGFEAARFEVVLQNPESCDSGIQNRGIKVILGQAPVGGALGGQWTSQWLHLLQTRPDRHFLSG